MADSLTAFVQKMDRLATQLEKAPLDSVRAVSKVYYDSTRAAVLQAAPGGRLSGVGKRVGVGQRKGASVGVRQRIVAESHSPQAFVQATGPLQLLEGRTARHDIPATRGSRRLRTASGRLSQKREATSQTFSGRTFLGNQARGFAAMGPISHPGTKGKHPFERGANAAEEAASSASQAVVARILVTVFRG